MLVLSTAVGALLKDPVANILSAAKIPSFHVSEAIEAGMQVRDGVAKNLQFLCCGSNAGPKKVESSREKGVLIIVASQFSHMIETGEIPIEQD